MKKNIITFTTDWGTKDHYVATVKAKLLSLINKDITFVDVSHHIAPLQVFQAAFVLKNCMYFFPKGTVHIISVRAEATPQNPHVVVQHNDSYFIGSDNGVFNLLFDKFDKAYEIDVFQDSDYFTFPARDVFAKVAATIINDGKISNIGHEITKLNSQIGYFNPANTLNSIVGVVIHIDNYGNIITNISFEEFKKVVKNQKFTISFGNYIIEEINTSYIDVPDGEIIALFNTSGLLEIAQNNGNIASLLGIKFNDIVKINIEE